MALRDLGTPPGVQEGADGLDFDLFAWRMVTGHGYSWADGAPTAFRAPGFPFFLAGIYAVFGHSFAAARVGFWIIGGVSVVLTYLLGRLMLDERAARIAGGLAAVYFPHVYLASAFFNENLFAPLLAGALVCFLRGLPERKWTWLAGAGVLLGLATLVRPFSLLLLPLLSLLLISQEKAHWKQMTTAISAFTLCFGAVCLPWLARNQVVLGKAAFATNGGTTFWGGNNSLVASGPQLWGTWVSSRELPNRAEIDRIPDEIGQERKEWELGLGWVRHHPGQFALLVTAKLVRMCLPDFGSSNLKYTVLAVLLSTPILALTGIGIAATVTSAKLRTSAWRALQATLVATLITGAVFWGAPRFRDANAPVLMVFAAVGTVRAMSWLPRRRPVFREPH